jgi:hypothetical protein
LGISRAGLRGALIAAFVTFVTTPPAAGTTTVAIGAPATGAIDGVVTTNAGPGEPLRVGVDPEVCGETMADESIVVDAAGRLANAVIAVVGVSSAAPAEAVITNDRCRFSPRVALMRPKGSIRMTSRDPVLHTMHAAAPGGRAYFNVSLPIPNLTLSRSIDERGVVQLSCSTHTWMRGYLHVTDELSAVSGPDGRFRIDGVPPGRHRLRIWHETLSSPDVMVEAVPGKTATVAVTLSTRTAG